MKVVSYSQPFNELAAIMLLCANMKVWLEENCLVVYFPGPFGSSHRYTVHLDESKDEIQIDIWNAEGQIVKTIPAVPRPEEVASSAINAVAIGVRVIDLLQELSDPQELKFMVDHISKPMEGAMPVGLLTAIKNLWEKIPGELRLDLTR